jgi:hypothetical protein
MGDIIKSILSGINDLPKSFGSSLAGGIMVTILLIYAMTLGAPILRSFLEVQEKIKVKPIDGAGDGKGGTFKVNTLREFSILGFSYIDTN